MLIQNWMSRPVVTIGPTTSMQGATDMMAAHRIHALPVVRGDQLVGILTDGDLKKASASDATSLDIHELRYLLEKIKVSSLMTPRPKSIRSNRTLAEAADLFLLERLSALPILDHRERLVGILTPSDVARAFLALIAHDRRGVEIGLAVEDRPGAAMAVVEIVRTSGGRLASLISTTSRAPLGSRHVYCRIYALAPNRFSGMLRELRFLGDLLYVVDHKSNHRDILEPAETVAVAEA